MPAIQSISNKTPGTQFADVRGRSRIINSNNREPSVLLRLVGRMARVRGWGREPHPGPPLISPSVDLMAFRRRTHLSERVPVSLGLRQFLRQISANSADEF